MQDILEEDPQERDILSFSTKRKEGRWVLRKRLDRGGKSFCSFRGRPDRNPDIGKMTSKASIARTSREGGINLGFGFSGFTGVAVGRASA